MQIVIDRPELEQTQWIPCSERLPEYMVSVLTWDGGAICIQGDKKKAQEVCRLMNRDLPKKGKRG